MGLHALIQQSIALSYAKTVLLIYHHQPQMGKLHWIFQQGMGAHQHLQIAICQVGQELTAASGGGGTGEQAAADRQLGHPLA